jgi:hypothetical protein
MKRKQQRKLHRIPGPNESLDKGGPLPTALSSNVNLISLQREIKCAVSGDSSRTLQLEAGLQLKLWWTITIQKLFIEKNLHFFTFNTKADKPVTAIIRHLVGTISAEDITVPKKGS